MSKIIKHNMESIMNEYYSCYQIIFAMYASYQKRKYDMIFAESWDFKYEKDDQPFGISLGAGFQDRSELLLEKYHGIKIKHEQYTSKENLLEWIQLLLPDSPIMLYYDVFNCPWNIAYRRNHIRHSILIIGIDDKTKHLYVLDPYSTKDENIINIKDFAQDKGVINSFVVKPLNNFKREDYHLEIVNNLNHIKNIDFFNNLENFYNGIQTRFEEVIFSEYVDAYAIPLINNLRGIANQRYCYCIFLNKMVNVNLIDYSIVNTMENIAQKYSFLRTRLLKQIIKKKHNSENIAIINEIISNEYEVYEKMKSFI